MAHVHAEYIKCWADGVVIQKRSEDVHGVEEWTDDETPTWNTGCIYRCKPERDWPMTSYTAYELVDIYNSQGLFTSRLEAIANAAIKKYILDTENNA